jgi:hypothetical protein
MKSLSPSGLVLGFEYPMADCQIPQLAAPAPKATSEAPFRVVETGREHQLNLLRLLFLLEAANGPRSISAFANLKRIYETRLDGQYEIE